ncbi:hypothetical protein [Sphingomonas sp. GM_Shp_1]|uniref:hypothetical protein n=1 Tax=Sphingomonas sp. GM_Shp_1 TaxID=2937381 RepID=UPI00226B78FE|nr:hypothetical protein [Sphingomonas sp. GM_Shp_1]
MKFFSDARLSLPTICVAASLPIVTASARDYRAARFADGSAKITRNQQKTPGGKNVNL